MSEIRPQVEQYLHLCQYQRRLDLKTIKAYRIDLLQFCTYLEGKSSAISKATLSDYIMFMNQKYKPRSVKRKIASIKAFVRFLESEDVLPCDPFRNLSTVRREPLQLPRTVPLRAIEEMLSSVHANMYVGTAAQKRLALRDAAIIETLFATGIRVSELCALNLADIDLQEGDIRIYGKGAKERMIQIGNADVLSILRKYSDTSVRTRECVAFFTNRIGERISEQSVRLILRKYEKFTSVKIHVTPHMIRHSFATLLLEESVDIRYIQRMLGHSSILTTQIYTHVANAKQKELLASKHPRNKICL